jgi:hypothetical protein
LRGGRSSVTRRAFRKGCLEGSQGACRSSGEVAAKLTDDRSEGERGRGRGWEIARVAPPRVLDRTMLVVLFLNPQAERGALKENNP